MIWLYRLAMYLAYGLIYPVVRIKAALGNPIWRGRLLLEQPASPVDLWLHAASVGEVRVMSHLIDCLHGRQPSLSVHVTVMTQAGAETARQIFAPEIGVSFLPPDLPHLMRRKLGLLRPRLLVIAETEIWPNLIASAHNEHIPIVQVNGRMSERAFRRYARVRRSLTGILAAYERFFLKSADDAFRFASFGVSGERVTVAGDMKFDAPITERSDSRRAEIRKVIGIDASHFLLVAGSTRPGEEEILLDCLASLRSENTPLRLALAPRHLERIPEIVSLIAAKNLVPILHSSLTTDGAPLTGPDQILLVDRMGLLGELYLAADLAFVGGTLAPLGGHNILEPVWAGSPVIFGPSLDNVRDAAEYIVSGNYGAQVDRDSICATIAATARHQRTFSRKTASGNEHSATSLAADFLLKRLAHA